MVFDPQGLGPNTSVADGRILIWNGYFGLILLILLPIVHAIRVELDKPADMGTAVCFDQKERRRRPMSSSLCISRGNTTPSRVFRSAGESENMGRKKDLKFKLPRLVFKAKKTLAEMKVKELLSSCRILDYWIMPVKVHQ